MKTNAAARWKFSYCEQFRKWEEIECPGVTQQQGRTWPNCIVDHSVICTSNYPHEQWALFSKWNRGQNVFWMMDYPFEWVSIITNKITILHDSQYLPFEWVSIINNEISLIHEYDSQYSLLHMYFFIMLCVNDTSNSN